MEEIFFFLCHVIHILKIHPPMVLGGRIQNEVFQRIKKCRKSSLVAPLLSTSSWMRVLCFKLVLVLCTDQQRNQLSKDTLLSFDCFTQGGNKYVVQSCSTSFSRLVCHLMLTSSVQKVKVLLPSGDSWLHVETK